MIKKRILKWLFKKLLTRPCLGETPIGEEGKAVNCFTVRLLGDNRSDRFLAKKFSPKKDTLTALKFNTNKDMFLDETLLNIDECLKYDIEVLHHYGPYTFRYKNIYKLLFARVTRRDGIRLELLKWRKAIAQAFFNKKWLITPERVEILRCVLKLSFGEVTLSSQETTSGTLKRYISVYDILEHLYPGKWLAHPMYEVEKEKIKLYLESFENSGELESYQGNKLSYRATGNAFQTMEAYEKEAARHQDAQRLQKVIALLTGVIAIGTLQQAGLLTDITSRLEIFWDLWLQTLSEILSNCIKD